MTISTNASTALSPLHYLSLLLYLLCGLGGLCSLSHAQAQDPTALAPKLDVNATIREGRTLVAEYRKRLKTLTPAEGTPRYELETAHAKLNRLAYMLRYYRASEVLAQAVRKDVDQIKTATAVAEGKTAYTATSGMREEGYYADNDGSYQPYARFLPSTYSGDEDHPLIVYLHGYNSKMNVVNWILPPDEMIKFAEEAGFVVALPFARSNTDFQNIGEQDVLRVIERVKARYAIDDDRVLLAGVSMGGMGTWTIGTHHPHLFSGLLIISGRGDYYAWHRKVDPATVPLYKQRLIQAEFGSSMLDNIRHLPVYSYHGTADYLIPISEARFMAQRMKTLNPQFKFREVPGGSHWIYDDAFADKAIQDWIRACERVTPDTLRYRSFTPKFNRGYYAQLQKFDLTSLQAYMEISQGPTGATATLNGAAKLGIDELLLPDGLGREKITCEKPVAEAVLTPKWHFGPIRDVYLEPFAIVQAQSAPATRWRDDVLAGVKDWYRFSKAQPRVRQETALTQEDFSGLDLIFMGSPTDSPAMTRILAASPISGQFSVEKEYFVVKGRRFPRKGTGFMLRQQSPWSSQRSVVVQVGAKWGQHMGENHRYDYLPSYIVYKNTRDATDPDGANEVLCAGFLDRKGKIIDEFHYVHPDYRASHSPED